MLLSKGLGVDMAGLLADVLARAPRRAAAGAASSSARGKGSRW